MLSGVIPNVSPCRTLAERKEKSYPAKIRTWTNSTKNCRATVTLPGNHECTQANNAHRAFPALNMFRSNLFHNQTAQSQSSRELTRSDRSRAGSHEASRHENDDRGTRDQRAHCPLAEAESSRCRDEDRQTILVAGKTHAAPQLRGRRPASIRHRRLRREARPEPDSREGNVRAGG